MNYRNIYMRVAEIVVGMMFVFSGFGKVDSAQEFGELISKYGFDWFSILSPIIIIAEIAIGMLLLLRIATKITAWISFFVLFIFTVAYSYANFIHGIEDCGCFGNLGVQLPAWATYLRNIILLILTFYIAKNSPLRQVRWTWASAIVMMSVMLASTFWTGHTWDLSTFYANKYPIPHPLIGQEVKHTPLASYVNAAQDSTYIVWVFSYSCSGCINSIENIKQYQTGVADHFIPLSVNEDSQGRMHKLLSIPFEAKNVGNTLSGFVINVPTLLYITHGRIKFVIEDGVPSVIQFKHLYLGMTEKEILRQTY